MRAAKNSRHEKNASHSKSRNPVQSLPGNRTLTPRHKQVLRFIHAVLTLKRMKQVAIDRVVLDNMRALQDEK